MDGDWSASVPLALSALARITDLLPKPSTRYIIGERYEIRKIHFLTAAIYGLIVLLSQYFLIEKHGIDTPPAITHPEYYYGFIGVAVAFQIVFLIISRDPVKYRQIMLAAVVEKFSFAITCLALFAQGRLAGTMLAAGAIDLLLGILFIVSWFETGRMEIELVNEFEN